MSPIELATIWMSRMAMNMPTTISTQPARLRAVNSGAAGATG